MSKIKLPWSGFKSLKDANTSCSIIYCSELKYHSEGCSSPDENEYFLRMTIGSSEYICLIDKEDTAPDPSDQKDFEDNYKSGGIEV